jgi:5-(carboxyamino)imidazole ribonucleotide mutase
MPKSKTSPLKQKTTKPLAKTFTKTLVSIVMGSQSDYETLQQAEQVLDEFSIPYEIQVVSAHRTPKLMYKFAQDAAKRNLKVIIAGAGGSAHLPGMIASLTTIPVLGVPIESKTLKGLDSLLSIVQMPAGIPTATFAIGNAGAINAALFAIEILSLSDKILQKKLIKYRTNNSKKALAGNIIVQQRLREKKK